MADIDDVDGHMTRSSKREFTKHVQTETIAEEAMRLVYGAREETYDDPNRNFKKLAHMWTGTLLELLKPGAELTPQLVALCLIQLKISRESFKPTRENRVDGIGYWLCEDRVIAEEAKIDGPVKLPRNSEGEVVWGKDDAV